MLDPVHRLTVSVRVPRGAAGDVAGGVRGVVGDVADVDDVEVHDLESVRPDALDLYVDARVAVAFADDVDDPVARLRGGFGVLKAAVD